MEALEVETADLASVYPASLERAVPLATSSSTPMLVPVPLASPSSVAGLPEEPAAPQGTVLGGSVVACKSEVLCRNVPQDLSENFLGDQDVLCCSMPQDTR